MTYVNKMAHVKKIVIASLLITIALMPRLAQAETLRVASSANFAPTLKKLLPDFEQKHHVNVQVISAATGTLYQQILHHAPFDVFLSADAIRPERLIKEGLGVADSLTLYTIGGLSLYSQKHPEISFNSFKNNLNSFSRVAIANPAFAPYGIAAKQALQHSELWELVQKKLILGININQTFQQVRSQSANVGIVATSQLTANNLAGDAIPQHLYQPILQKGVIISSTKIRSSAQKLLTYLTSDKVQQQLVELGYLNVANFSTNKH